MCPVDFLNGYNKGFYFIYKGPDDSLLDLAMDGNFYCLNAIIAPHNNNPEERQDIQIFGLAGAVRFVVILLLRFLSPKLINRLLYEVLSLLCTFLNGLYDRAHYIIAIHRFNVFFGQFAAYDCFGEVSCLVLHV